MIIFYFFASDGVPAELLLEKQVSESYRQINRIADVIVALFHNSELLVLESMMLSRKMDR